MDILKTENLVLAAKIAAGTAAAVLVIRISRKIFSRKKEECPQDIVILHHPGRGPEVPSMVPFAVKLETYLRMAKIPFKGDFTFNSSKKHKFPWIEYNGEAVADSEFCIEYLNKEFDINLDKSFSPKDLGIARAFQKTLEENSYWVLVADRWLFDPKDTVTKVLKIPFFLKFTIRRKLNQMLYAQGMGRHTKEEIHHILEKDLKALSDFLGAKKFLLGDTACQADCAIFGQLSQIYWQSFGMENGTIMRKFNNLCYYCERMKSTFWPDWEQCVTHQKLTCQ